MKMEESAALRAVGGDPGAPPEQHVAFVDLNPFRSMSLVVDALRRRWRFWTAAAIWGIAGALALSIAFPPKHSATTRLFVRTVGQGNAADLMANELALLQTRTVARQAIQTLGLRMSAQDLISDYTASASSNNVLQLTVSGPSATEAIRRAGAVAEAFLDFRRKELRRQAEEAASSLEKRRDELAAELSTVTERIDNFSGEGDADVRFLGELLTRRSTLNGQIDQLNQQIDAAVADSESAAAESTVIDPASEDPRSPIRAMARNMVAGMIGGVGVGAGVVIVRELATDRVRLRSAVRDALGAPVAVSLGSLRGSPRRLRRQFYREVHKPSADVSRAVRHLRESLSRCDSLAPSLVVVSVDSDGPAALSVAATARELVNEDKSVFLADQSRRSALAQLLEAGARGEGVLHLPGIPSGARLMVPSAQQSDAEQSDKEGLAPSEVLDTSDTVMVLASIDLGLGAHHLARWATRAVVFVTAGRSTATTLRSVADLLRVAGVELDSAILVGSDRNDDTLGLFESSVGERSWDRSGDWVRR